MNDITTLLVIYTYTVVCQGILRAKVLKGKTGKEIFHKI